MTTITLSPALSERVEKAAKKRGQSAEAVIENLLKYPSVVKRASVNRRKSTLPIGSDDGSAELNARTLLAEAQCIAERINRSMDTIHNDFRDIHTDLEVSILSVRAARELVGGPGD